MRVLWATLLIILIDQISKVFVKGSAPLRIKGLPLGESIPVIGEWFRITFTENPGMAFGIEVDSKLALTLFSILATIAITVYLWYMKKAHWGYRLSLALILGGAIGNIIDRVFYGVWYGYGTVFHGNVVDFIHFDLWRGMIPDWVPLVGGQWAALLPVWNVADMSIVAGVCTILVFQNRFQRWEDAHRKADAPMVVPEEEPDTVRKDDGAPHADSLEPLSLHENDAPLPDAKGASAPSDQA